MFKDIIVRTIVKDKEKGRIKINKILSKFYIHELDNFLYLEESNTPSLKDLQNIFFVRCKDKDSLSIMKTLNNHEEIEYAEFPAERNYF